MVVCYLTFWLEACDCFREKNIVEADSVSEFCELCDILHEACDCFRERTSLKRNLVVSLWRLENDLCFSFVGLIVLYRAGDLRWFLCLLSWVLCQY